MVHVSGERTSSMNMTAGKRVRATMKSARINFSPSPIHLLISVAGLMLKNVAPH
jgi:hypothetical protein